MTDWQDIATAPRDGTKVLGYCRGGDWMAVIWCEPGTTSWQGRPFWSNVREQVDPTHWSPLPAAPKDGE